MLKGALIVVAISSSSVCSACDWIYKPAYSVRLSYLQGESGYGKIKRFIREEQMIRNGEIPEKYPDSIKRNYSTNRNFSELQLSMLYDMVEDAYMYAPDRDEYTERQYHQASKDFADDWVRECKDRVWILD